MDPVRAPARAGRRRLAPDPAPPGSPGPAHDDHEPRAGRRRTPTPCCCSCGSAGRPRARTTRPGRWSAAASGRRRPARAGWPRRCAPFRSCSTSPTRSGGPAPAPGSSTSPTRWASSPGRCCRPGTGRSACATWPSASSAGSRLCSAVEPERVGLDHVGLNHLTWERAVLLDGVDVLPGAARRARRRPRRGDRAAARPASSGSRSVPSYYLRYFYAHDEVVRELRRPPSRASEVAAIEKALLDLYADPAVVEKPAELREAGRRVLLRGRGRPRGVAGRAGCPERRRRPCTWSTCATTAPCRSSTTTHVIEVPARVGAAGRRARADGAARAAVSRDSSPTSRRTSGSPSTAALEGGRERVFDALLAHPLVGQIDLADRLTDRLLAHNHSFLTWA